MNKSSTSNLFDNDEKLIQLFWCQTRISFTLLNLFYSKQSVAIYTQQLFFYLLCKLCSRQINIKAHSYLDSYDSKLKFTISFTYTDVTSNNEGTYIL